MLKKIIPAVCTVMVLINCTDKKEKVLEKEILSEKIKAPIEIVRLDRELFADRSKEGIKTFIKNNPAFNRKYFGKYFPDDKTTISEVFAGINNKSIDTVYQNIQDEFGDLSELNTSFGVSASNIKTYYPNYNPQKLITFISGMGFWGPDMYIDDTLAIISLDFFLGRACKYEPQLPKYILKRYTKENISPFIVSMIANSYNKTDFLDNSLIAEMVYYGKSYYFLEKTLFNNADSVVAGYSGAEIKEIESHQEIVWAHLIEKNLLFETKHDITNKYVGERPNVPEIGNNCPGRIGRWLGWQIVRKYMNSYPEITLPELMAEKDARKIFNLSKYRPKNN